MASTQLKEQDLAGKVAVITGASRGIGRAVAMNLAARGCSILGTCSSSESVPLISSQLNDEVLALYTSASHTRTSQVLGLGISIYSKDCAKTIANSIEKYFSGRVDILVSNAADANPGILGNLTVEEIEKSLLANVQTPVLIVDELVKRRLFQPDSRIIYVSSIRTRQPWSMQLMYSAGKSAGESLCRSWAEAFGGKEEKFGFMAGTTANSVTVGLTETDSVLQCPAEQVEKFKQEFIPLQSIPRFGQPEDIADVVGFLCHRDARWITGSVISASGGGIKIG